MTTPQLITAVGSEDAVRLVFSAVADVLLKAGRVEIDGFGTFELHTRKARRARNPRTGEPIEVPAKVTVKFKPTGALKRQAGQLPGAPNQP